MWCHTLHVPSLIPRPPSSPIGWPGNETTICLHKLCVYWALTMLVGAGGQCAITQGQHEVQSSLVPRTYCKRQKLGRSGNEAMIKELLCIKHLHTSNEILLEAGSTCGCVSSSLIPKSHEMGLGMRLRVIMTWFCLLSGREPCSSTLDCQITPKLMSMWAAVSPHPSLLSCPHPLLRSSPLPFPLRIIHT